eukprot:gene20589-27387_t
MIRQKESPLHIVRWLSKSVKFGSSTQRRILHILQDPVFCVLPLKDSYRTRLLKLLFNSIESNHDTDIIDELAELLGELMTSAPMGKAADEPPNWCYKSYTYGEADAQALAPQALVDGLVVKQHAVDVAKAVVDFESGSACDGGGGACEGGGDSEVGRTGGCGAGAAAGCAVAEGELLDVHGGAAGASSTALTDGVSDTLRNCQMNLQMNGIQSEYVHSPAALHCSVKHEGGRGSKAGVHMSHPTGHLEPTRAIQVCELPWNDEDGACCLEPDVIVGSDLLYNPDFIPDLVGILSRLLRRPCREDDACSSCTHSVTSREHQPRAYLATTVRTAENLEYFSQQIEAHNLQLQDMSQEAHESRVHFYHAPNLVVQGTDRLVLHQITAPP